jgi:hypothetical protein
MHNYEAIQPIVEFYRQRFHHLLETQKSPIAFAQSIEENYAETSLHLR